MTSSNNTLAPSLLLLLEELQLDVFGHPYTICLVPVSLFHDFYLFVSLCCHLDNFF